VYKTKAGQFLVCYLPGKDATDTDVQTALQEKDQLLDLAGAPKRRRRTRTTG
jgi:hypothetical protein